MSESDACGLKLIIMLPSGGKTRDDLLAIPSQHANLLFWRWEKRVWGLLSPYSRQTNLETTPEKRMLLLNGPQAVVTYAPYASRCSKGYHPLVTSNSSGYRCKKDCWYRSFGNLMFLCKGPVQFRLRKVPDIPNNSSFSRPDITCPKQIFYI